MGHGMKRGFPVLLVAALAAFGQPAAAHQLNVFATSDCEAVTVEAKFTSGKRPVAGEVRVKGEADALLATLPLGEDGTARIPLSSLDHAGGLVIEVDTGGHDDYWILTPEDLKRNCGE